MWTAKQHAQAVGEGWKLTTTFDNGDIHPFYDIVDHGPKFPNAKFAKIAVIEAAKHGSALHQQALRLELESRQRPATPARKKR